MTQREQRIRAAMRRMTKHQLYRFMDKGHTRLSRFAHEERDQRRGMASSWRDPSERRET
jgi:hypothetical protein